MKRVLVVIFIFMMILAALPGRVPAGQAGSVSINGAVKIGDSAPPIEGVSLLDNCRWSLSEVAGRSVILDFGSIFCRPCQNVLISLASIANRYGDEVIIVHVNQDSPKRAEAVANFIKGLKAPMVVIMDSDHRAASDYGVTVIPYLVRVGPDKAIETMWVGAHSDLATALGLGGKP